MTQPMTTPRTLNPAEAIRGFASSIRSVIMSSQLAACSLQLATCNLADPRTQSAVKMCVVYLILDSVAALATTGRRPPQYLRVSDDILDRGQSAPGALVGSGFGFGLVFGWGISRYRPCFTLPSGQGDRVGVAAIIAEFDVFQFKQSLSS